MTFILFAAVAMVGVGIGIFIVYNILNRKPIENLLMEISGELRLNYYIGSEGKQPFSTGTYSGRGVTLDLLNEKGYVDRWHPHSRIVVSVDKSVKETYIVAVRGRFYSRKLAEINVDNRRFSDKYVFLSSSPVKAEKVLSPEVAEWIVNLDMPFILVDGHIEFHQDRHFDDKKRIKHIIDAMIYIAHMAERVK
ncbi:MAG: hypothetical protein V1875_08820 [Candidatus Altiarchaeota archaeon]